MTIARIDNYELRHKTYIGEHTLMTHEIEIIYWEHTDDRDFCYTIAGFNDDGEIISCGDRLLDCLVEEPYDIDTIRTLSEIAAGIIGTSNVPVRGV